MLLEAAEQTSATPVYAGQLTYDAMRIGAAPRRIAASLERDRRALRLAADGRLRRARRGPRGAATDGRRSSSPTRSRRSAPCATRAEAAADAATLFAREGREDSARRAAARSAELYRLGEGAPPPRHRGPRARGDVALTRREQQLVDLARQGLTNAQIAERLVLSVRTVESHLYRAMQKLGATDRRQL